MFAVMSRGWRSESYERVESWIKNLRANFDYFVFSRFRKSRPRRPLPTRRKERLLVSINSNTTNNNNMKK